MLSGYKKRFEEIKSERDILSHTIPSKIFPNEEEDAHKWWINHKCLIDENKWPETEIGCIYPTIILNPTSIGSTILVTCPRCGESKDVTDYTNW